jgi:hypothetical protein
MLPNSRANSSASGLIVMNYKYLLTLIGLVLIAIGFVERGWFILLVWLGGNFSILGLAHWRGAHRVFGKRPDGIIQIWHGFIFLPLLTYTSFVWHLTRLFTRESAYNMVTEQLVVGRRLLPSELGEKFDNYVDLTAEFSEPAAIRLSPAYRCFPILDGATPTPHALRQAVSRLRQGRTFIHCAQGHGRTGLFVLAILLSSGVVSSVEDGLRILTTARPAIRLNREQRECIRIFAKQL